MKELLKRGATSNILRVFLQDSAVTTGAGKTGLTNASSGLIISTIADLEATATTYTSAASNVETITTLGTFAAPTAGKCRFKEVDATNFPGVYEIQIADARFNVSNSTQLLVSIQCTGVAPVFAEYQLIAVDLLDTVRFGLTALPNVASGSAGAIITSGTGTAQLATTSGNVTVGTNNDKTGYSLTQAFPSNFSSLAITAGGAVTAGTVSDKTGYSLTQTFPANFSSLAITAGGIVTANTTQLAGQTVTAAAGVTFPASVSNLTAANVWDTNISGYTTAGYAGTYLKGAGAAGDPWTAALPGAYGAGTAGYIVGTNLNATITSRMATFTLPTNFSSLAITGGGAVTAGTVSDKTGYSLATSQTFSTTGSVGSVTGAVGSVTGAVGSVTGAVGSVSGDVSGKVLGGGAGTITGDGVRAASVTGAVGSVTAAVTVGTNNDKTGYSLSGSQTFSTTGSVGSVTGSVGSVTGNVGGNVAGSVNSVTGSVGSVTGNVGGNVVGSVASVTNAVTVGTINANAINAAAIATDAIDADAIAASAVAEIQSGLSTLTAAQAENAVWNAATSAHTTAGTYGQLIVRTDGTNGNEVKVTAAHHIAADVHEVQPGTFVDADWAAGSTYSKLGTLIEADTPTGYRYTAQALEQAPTAAGGATTVRMGPFQVKADGGGADQPLDIQAGATHAIDCTLIDGTGTGIDLTGATLTAKVYNDAGTLIESPAGTASYAALGLMRWTITTTTTNTPGTYTVTITRTTGASDTQIFGPLRLYVREV